MTTTADSQLVRDLGQQIGVEYWRKNAHCFSAQGQDKPCGLCLLAQNPLHKEREPYPPQPTIVSVVSDGKQGYHFTATLSCGHGPVGFATLPEHAPNVGGSYDCWDCRRPVDDRNQPGLPDEVRERIEAQLPKCPTCGGPIDTIPFIKRTVHKYQADIDFQTGEILAGSEHWDTLEEEPDWTLGVPPVIEVECTNGHSWEERRLSYRRKDGESIWTVLPPVEVQS